MMDYTDIAFGMIGGLGLFLYGMQLMGDGLQKVAGDRMRHLLEILTKNPIIAILVGTGVTAIIQSSSATTVMVVGFVNAGLMGLKQAIGVILGASIGTTITTQLVSFKLTDMAEPCIGLGVVMTMIAGRKTIKHTGRVILGFGILFYGMGVMSNAMYPLRTYAPFVDMLASIGEIPLRGILIGACFTALVQSSSATTAIVVALATQGLLGLTEALPLIIGSNIGTTVTALLAAINTSVDARRAAVAHFMFKVGGAILFFFILEPFAWVARLTSSDVARQVANAHTIFNVTNTLLVLPFIGSFAKLVGKIVPGTAEEPLKPILYLDRKMLAVPSVALAQSKLELLRMGKLASQMLDETLLAFKNNDVKLLQTARKKEEIINEQERQIINYLVEVTKRSLSHEQSQRLNAQLEIVNDIERIGDHADNITELAEMKIERKLPFSEQGIIELDEIYNRCKTILTNALRVLEFEEHVLAGKVMAEEDEIDLLETDLRRRHIDRLNKQVCNPNSGIVFLDTISNLERIADHACSIARAAIHH